MLLRRDRCRQFAIFSGTFGYFGSLHFVICVSDLAVVLTDAALAEQGVVRGHRLHLRPRSRCIDCRPSPPLLARHEVSSNIRYIDRSVCVTGGRRRLSQYPENAVNSSVCEHWQLCFEVPPYAVIDRYGTRRGAHATTRRSRELRETMLDEASY